MAEPIEFERDGYTYHVEVRAFLPGQPTASQYAAPEDLAAAGYYRDEPDLDATDGAHPAWWRGHDNGAKGMLEVKAKLEKRVAELLEALRLSILREFGLHARAEKAEAELAEARAEIGRICRLFNYFPGRDGV